MSFKSLLCLLLLIPVFAFGKDKEEYILKATRVEVGPKIDGYLDDEVWKLAQVATDFTQESPNPLQPANHKTEVRIVYTDEAVYVAAYMFDDNPDNIMDQYTSRDGFGNSDWFGIWFSCFNDGINAFEFFSTPQGVQMDAQVSTYGEDFNWNAVWESRSSLVENGWITEMKIPYSALRFPNKEVQEWDINFIREVRKTREKSTWYPIDPEVPGWIQQSGKLKGITSIEPPVRLFLYPYFSTYLINGSDDNGNSVSETTFNGGLDLKYGLTDAFTLDMTLIPDFGQVQSDNQVLNLSAFEVQFNENRQFFTEGTELFSKGDLFYSRRIGGEPINYYKAQEGEEIIEQPSQTKLINVAKISGRNSHGLGIGVLNAVSRREYALVKDSLGQERQVETSPFTNFNIMVLDQNLKNNSYFTLINTNVLRDGSTYDANVIGSEFSLRNKKNSVQFLGNAAYNKKHNFTEGEPDDGYKYGFGLQKTNGQLRFGGDLLLESKYYDPNDLGLNFSANEMGISSSLSYNIFEPFMNGKFNSLWSNIKFGYNMLQSPNVYTGKSINATMGLSTKRFHAFGFGLSANPGYSYDYFEPRVSGKYFRTENSRNFDVWISTDYSRKFALDINHWQNFVGDGRWHSFNYRIAPRVQVGNKIFLTYVYSRQNEYDQMGFRTFQDHDQDENTDETPVFTRRDRITHTNVLETNYVFNNRMSATLRVRHYWSFVDQKQFYDLSETGELVTSYFSGFDESGHSPYDISLNFFNVDLVYKWVFAPGSEVSVVWKNSIADDTPEIISSFSDNFNNLIEQNQTNSFSIKVLYFIDYYTVKSKLKG